MSNTIRWWQKRSNFARLSHDEQQYYKKYVKWKYINPFYSKHELKYLRVEQHRALRRNNKIRLQKGFDIETPQKTCGWMTH